MLNRCSSGTVYSASFTTRWPVAGSSEPSNKRSARSLDSFAQANADAVSPHTPKSANTADGTSTELSCMRGLRLSPARGRQDRRGFAHRCAHRTVAHASDVMDGADRLDAVTWPAGKTWTRWTVVDRLIIPRSKVRSLPGPL